MQYCYMAYSRQLYKILLHDVFCLILNPVVVDFNYILNYTQLFKFT